MVLSEIQYEYVGIEKGYYKFASPSIIDNEPDTIIYTKKDVRYMRKDGTVDDKSAAKLRMITSLIED